MTFRSFSFQVSALPPLMRRRHAKLAFWTLTVAATAGTFLLPPDAAGPAQATAGGLLAPVSLPAYRVGRFVANVASVAYDEDALLSPAERSRARLERERDLLRVRNASLLSQLELLQTVHRDRAKLGKPLMARLAAGKIVGRDGTVVTVLNSDFAPFAVGMPALQYGPDGVGVAGVVSAVGLGTAQVRLVSDPSMRVIGGFVRADAEAGTMRRLETEPPLVEGDGFGACRVARHREADLDRAGVVVGDWVVLADAKWPEELLGMPIGRVTQIEPLVGEPGFARVEVRPTAELSSLGEVMVMYR